MISLQLLRKLSPRWYLVVVVVFAVNIFSADAQDSTKGQLRMTYKEILETKAVSPAAPGSSNLTSIQVIVIHGDPSVRGLYTILLKVPANTKIAAHIHPDDRVCTVISGTWYFGYGDTFDKNKLKELSPGSIYTEPEGQNHFAMTGKSSVIIEITGYGPSGTTYVKTADDPQKKEK